VRVSRVGVIGLDRGGRGVVRRLMDHGFAVTVHDADPRAVTSMAEEGAAPARIPADAAELADVVVVHEPGEVATEQALFDCGGVGETLGDGGVVVTASATGSQFVLSAADRLRTLGLNLVEAWFSDDSGDATTVFAGGDPEDVAAVAPVLRAVAVDVRHIGPLGSVSALRTAVAALATVQPFAGHEP
jgi:3-hydroxyisobutyrate dehydrogenase-like beta-hydroxyacid dehydrogenase